MEHISYTLCQKTLSENYRMLFMYMQNFPCVVFIFHCVFFIYLFGGSFEASRVARTQDIKRTRSHAWPVPTATRPHMEPVVMDMSRRNSFCHFHSLILFLFLSGSLLLVFPSGCLMNYEDTIGSKGTKARLCFSLLILHFSSLLSSRISSPGNF